VMASVGSISSFPNFCTDTVILCNAACPLVMMPPKRVRRELSKSPTRGCPKSSWSGIQTASHEKPCLYKTGYLKGVFVQSRSSLLQRDQPREQPNDGQPAKFWTPSASRRSKISAARSVTLLGRPARRATCTP